MIIKKEYKIETMCEELKETIEEAYNKNNSFCEMGILFLRDILEVLEEVKAKTEEKTLVFAELENGTRTSGYYSTEEAGKALKKVIEKVNEGELKKDCFGCHINGNEKCNLCIYERKCMTETEKNDKKSCFGNYQDVYMCRNCDQIKECITKLNKEKNCTVDNKGVMEHLQQKCDECFFKDYELCECTNNSGSGFCPFRPLCFMNYGRDNISKCIGCIFGEECEWKSNNKAPSKKEPKLRKEWEERVKHAEKCYTKYKVEKAKKECLKAGRENEQKKH